MTYTEFTAVGAKWACEYGSPAVAHTPLEIGRDCGRHMFCWGLISDGGKSKLPPWTHFLVNHLSLVLPMGVRIQP